MNAPSRKEEFEKLKAVRESGRWHILVALDNGRPEPVGEDILLGALESAQPPDERRITPTALRRELDYLEKRELVKLAVEGDHWEASLTALGVDVVEYTVVDVKGGGIARPLPYGEMDFGAALQVLRNGGKVRRAGWNGKGMHVGLVPANTAPMTLPFLYLQTVSGDRVPWLISQTDALAEDYTEVA